MDSTNPFWNAVIDLRRRVLRTPLGLDFSSRDFELEADDCTCVALEGSEVVGVVMIRTDESGYRLRQMAVHPDRIGRGIGRRLVGFAEQWIGDAGGQKISLHARVTAIGFYESLGYEPVGPIFAEVTLPHRLMLKHLDLANQPALE